MKKYSWNFNGNAEIWDNDTFDTIEACIEDANAYADDSCNVVYIGENIPFVPTVDVESVLEYLEEQAAEHAGEIGGEWESCDYIKRDELDELEEKLTAVVHEWLKKYGRYPEFWAVENITAYPLV